MHDLSKLSEILGAAYGMGGGMMSQATSVPVSAGQIVMTANDYAFGDK